MLNKTKIGNFIREYRKKYVGSQEDLADKFVEKNIIVSAPNISDWERGIHLPDLQILSALSEIFKVTIDDLLEGEVLQDIDYTAKYYLADPNYFYKNTKGIPVDKLYEDRQFEIDKVYENFNFLLKKFIFGNASRSEEKELEFIVNHFFSYEDDLFSDLNKATYFVRFKNDWLIQEGYKKIGLTKKEHFETIRSKFIPNKVIRLTFTEICDAILTNNYFILNRFDKLSDIEKDAYLSAFQTVPPLFFNPNTYGSNGLKRFEEETGMEYSIDNIARFIIKYFIEHGAKLNPCFSNRCDQDTLNIKLVDEVEDYYISALAPLKIRAIDEEGKSKFYSIENNIFNRFCVNVFHILNFDLDYQPTELFDLFKSNAEPPIEYILKLAKAHSIDTNKEEKYIISDVFQICRYQIESWTQLRDEEMALQQKAINYKYYLELLESGIKEITNIVDNEDTNSNQDEVIEDRYKICAFLNHKYLLKKRNLEKTNELYQKLDTLTLKEIKKEYFPFVNMEEWCHESEKD